MLTLDALQERISVAFRELSFPESPSELYDPVRYTLGLGGKRLRPLLVLAACDMFGGRLEDAIHPAIGIELFHNFTLLHDDLMDQAPLRRGKATVYKKWNPNIAILAGDTMFALANREMLQTREAVVRDVSDLFNVTAIEVCEGQQFDMNFESSADVTIPQYLEMIRLKTAVLLAASLKTGALIAGTTKLNADLIYSFGIDVGLAFQLMDDLLDVYGAEDKFGKLSGGDILAAKKTFLYLKALECAGDEAESLQNLYHSKDLAPEEKISQVKSRFDSYGIERLTRLEMKKYWENALLGISKIDLATERKTPLTDYCYSLMAREL